MVLQQSSRVNEHPLYSIWKGMRERCNNPNHIRYARYGGRGITVCERWSSFSAFAADMGARPPGHSLDRIDNDGPYTPDNCRWASHGEQRRNAARTVMVTHRGKTQCVDDWAAELGVHRTTLRSRAEVRGWDYPAAIDTFTKDPTIEE